MKILFISSWFPKPIDGASIYTDLAEELFSKGHEVTVVVSEQIKSEKKSTIRIERNVEVLRIASGNYYDVGFIRKGVTTMMIPLLMKRGISKNLQKKKFDLILYSSPPVTIGKLIKWAKKKFSCKTYLMLKDIFPQNAIDLGIIKKKGFIYNFFLKKEEEIYKYSDVIGCMSKENKTYLLKKNPWLNRGKIELFPNTKKIINHINFKDGVIREKFSIPKDSCMFLFGGNMGSPQYISLLCYAIIECKNDKDVYFLFTGRGTDRYKLEQAIEQNEIKNAQVIKNLPRSEYDKIVNECDIGLIILDPRFTFPNYPSRILSYMEHSKPVLAATDMTTDIKELIKTVGFGEWVWSGDRENFVSKIRVMSKSNELTGMGEKGREYLEKEFNVGVSVKILENQFNAESEDENV